VVQRIEGGALRMRTVCAVGLLSLAYEGAYWIGRERTKDARPRYPEAEVPIAFGEMMVQSTGGVDRDDSVDFSG
jgi:hypothetical protein